MKVEVQIKEVNYGFVTIEVENEDEIYERAWDKIAEGDEVDWGKTDTDIINWKEVEE